MGLAPTWHIVLVSKVLASSLCFSGRHPLPPLAVYCNEPSVDEFHAKHGRHRGGGGAGRPRKKSVCISTKPDSTVVVSQGINNVVDGLTSNQDIDFPTATGENCKRNDDKVGSTLPAIAPSPPTMPERTTKEAAGIAHRRSIFSGDTKPASTADSGISVGGDGEGSATSPTQVTPLHMCVCCGAKGGLGHGRRCVHTFRRCGFCRVEEVKRVLGIEDTGRRGRQGTSASVREECIA